MAQAIKKVNWWHESICDWMLQNPEKSLTQCSIDFEVTQSWLSRIINSQLFKELLAQRRMNHSSNLSTSIIEKTEGVTHAALDEMEQRLGSELDRAGMTMSSLRDTAQMGLKAMGYTSQSSAALHIHAPGGNVLVNNAVPPEVLAEAREKMGKAKKNDEPGTEVAALPAPS